MVDDNKSKRRTKGRVLREDERRLWDAVRASVTPLTQPSVDLTPAPKQKSDQTTPYPMIGLDAPASIISQWPEPSPDIRAMAKSTQRAINRGLITPDAKIDLHGDRYEIARNRLFAFIAIASAQGNRTLLVVTGKGGTEIERENGIELSGVIRRALPNWLADQKMQGLVSHYTQAHRRHGGEGAWYIFVRPKSRLARKTR